jgi:hypothetical protein
MVTTTRNQEKIDAAKVASCRHEWREISSTRRNVARFHCPKCAVTEHRYVLPKDGKSSVRNPSTTEA